MTRELGWGHNVQGPIEDFFRNSWSTEKRSDNSQMCSHVLAPGSKPRRQVVKGWWCGESVCKMAITLFGHLLSGSHSQTTDWRIMY